MKLIMKTGYLIKKCRSCMYSSNRKYAYQTPVYNEKLPSTPVQFRQKARKTTKFVQIWNEIVVIHVYQPDWHNGPGYVGVLRDLFDVEQLVHACSVIIGRQRRLKQHPRNAEVGTKRRRISLHKLLVIFWQVTWSASMHQRTKLNTLS